MKTQPSGHPERPQQRAWERPPAPVPGRQAGPTDGSVSQAAPGQNRTEQRRAEQGSGREPGPWSRESSGGSPSPGARSCPAPPTPPVAGATGAPWLTGLPPNAPGGARPPANGSGAWQPVPSRPAPHGLPGPALTPTVPTVPWLSAAARAHGSPAHGGPRHPLRQTGKAPMPPPAPVGEACREHSRRDPKARPCLLPAAVRTGRLSPPPLPVPLGGSGSRLRRDTDPGRASEARSSSNCRPGAGSSTDCGPGGCRRRRRRFRARGRSRTPRRAPPLARTRVWNFVITYIRNKIDYKATNNLHKE